MDNFIIFSIFLLCLFLPLVIFSLVVKSVPKLKMRDAAPYLDEIARIKDSVDVSRVDEEDIKKIRGRIRHSVAFSTFTIVADVLAIVGLVNFAKDEEVTVGYIGIYIAVAGSLSAICLYKGVKNAKVFSHPDNFSKRNGVLLKFKEMYVPNTNGYKGTIVYQVLVGTYDDGEKPIVFRTEIPEFIFRAIQKNDKWSVIMYEGRPASIIKG